MVYISTIHVRNRSEANIMLQESVPFIDVCRINLLQERLSITLSMIGCMSSSFVCTYEDYVEGLVEFQKNLFFFF